MNAHIVLGTPLNHTHTLAQRIIGLRALRPNILHEVHQKIVLKIQSRPLMTEAPGTFQRGP